MEKYYKGEYYYNIIEEIEVESETEHSVKLSSGLVQRKSTASCVISQYRDKVKSLMLEKINREIEVEEQRLKYLKEKREKIEQL